MFTVLDIYHKNQVNVQVNIPYMDGMGWIKSPENQCVFTSTWPSFGRFLDFWLPKISSLIFFGENLLVAMFIS